eukprot:21035-Prymnesium_polylepis.1
MAVSSSWGYGGKPGAAREALIRGIGVCICCEWSYTQPLGERNPARCSLHALHEWLTARAVTTVGVVAASSVPTKLALANMHISEVTIQHFRSFGSQTTLRFRPGFNCL